MNYPPMKTLPIFVTAAEHESFLLASQKHYISLPAVSQQIKSLEYDLNCQLFIRANNAVKLTAQGKNFLELIRPAINSIIHAKKKVSQHENNTITISVLNSISTFCLIPFLGEFYEKHPKTDVRLSTNWALPPSDQNEVDLIIGYGKKNSWPNNKVDFLCSDQLIAVGHKDIIKNKSLSEVLKCKKLIMVDGIDFRRDDWKKWGLFHNVNIPPKDRFLRFGNTVQAIYACLNKLGVLITRELFVRDLIANHQLNVIGKTINNEDLGYYLIYQNEYNSHYMKDFISWIKTHLSQ